VVAADEEIVDTPGAPKADKPTPEGKKTAKTEVKPALKAAPKAESKAS
jgi:hypothetical protein